MQPASLVCFDGIAGPTHAHAGLSVGNVAAMTHAGAVGSPKAAALEGLAKMRLVASLGGVQAVLPPHERPHVPTLRRLGFSGSDREVLESAGRVDAGRWLQRVSSASAMWSANAATVAPSRDTLDGRVHLVVANLSSMFHRSLEAPTTLAVLRRVFARTEHFVVHEPLPAGAAFSDEGAANHIRLETSRGSRHVFGWGTSAFDPDEASRVPLARQTREASESVARALALPAERCLFARQDPRGIEAGAFHSDVLALGAGRFLMLHERAFVDVGGLIETLSVALGPELVVSLAREAELPLADAIQTYPFNAELVPLPGDRFALVAPAEAERSEPARAFLDRVVAEPTPVDRVVFADVNSSMKNGGGPACLRLAVSLEPRELAALGGRVLFDATLDAALVAWVEKHHRDRLGLDDLRDPALLDESRAALDELTVILGLGSIYDFQRA